MRNENKEYAIVRLVRTRLVYIGITGFLVGGTAHAVAAQEGHSEKNSQNTPTQSAVIGTPNASNPQSGGTLLARDPRYRICLSDVLDVTFPFTPEFNQTVTVQPDGFIALSGLGAVQVAGKSVSEANELIRVSAAKILHDPIVNIVLKEFEKPFFIASGEVARPGKYELKSEITLTQAVAIAGGFTESSKHSAVFVFRRVANNWVELKKVDVKSMLSTANLSEDLHLQPGDMFFVPQNRFSKVKRFIPSPGVGVNVATF